MTDRTQYAGVTHPLEEASARVALAAYLHDIGKFAERAGVFDQDARLEVNRQLYCPFHTQGRWFSHQHAACTALAFDLLEDHLPDILRRDTYPFAGWEKNEGASADPTDCLANASAAHHKPSTFLQWIVATADRVASGFEREEFELYNTGEDITRVGLDHFTARQLTLFEQIRLTGDEADEKSLRWRYPLAPLSPRGIFPVLATECEHRDRARARTEYRALWNAFVAGIAAIPRSHRANLALWLDHFDSLWLTHTQAIPAATAFNVRPEVSLYDHSKTTAALAVALWRWHEETGHCGDEAARALRSRSDYGTAKFLLVQGDFFGIQDFIFAMGGEARKQAAKLLRGRSFQVSLFTEAASLLILDLLGLPPTSQVVNAAGKFLVVAPNTPDCERRLETARERLDAWFLDQTFGQTGVGLAWLPAACGDFLKGKDGTAPFAALTQELRDSLERAKYRRFGIAGRGSQRFDVDFPQGPCAYHGRIPADRHGETDGLPSCALSRDQIAIGDAVTGRRYERLMLIRDDAASALRSEGGVQSLELPLWGYRVAFTAQEDATGRFGKLAAEGIMRRCWDYSLPAAEDESGMRSLWSGYARRFISGHVPHVHADDLAPACAGRYAGVDSFELQGGNLKTFDLLACEDRVPDPQAERWLGVAALGVLKGDIDDLGEVFRIGLRPPSFAKWAALSRQVNGFFAVYLPWLLVREFPNVYTVFAGGDDFLLVGPWRTVQKLAVRMRDEFATYVAGNAGIHFSAGIATQKPGAPVQALGLLADAALEKAKSPDGKNAVHCFGETVPWRLWPELEGALARLGDIRVETGLSTGFVYGLLQFVALRKEEAGGSPDAAIWRSRLAYRIRRMIVDRMKRADEPARRSAQDTLFGDIASAGIDRLGASYRIVLFNHLYQYRDR